MKFKKIIIFLFLSGSFLSLMAGSSALQGYSDDLFTNLDDKLLIAQGEFEEMYKDLLEKSFFSEDEKKLILEETIDTNVLKAGPVLLNLIEWLQRNRQEAPEAQILLHKLGRYFYFVFRNFVNEIDVDKKIKVQFYDLLHDLYKFKIPNDTSSNFVFQQFSYPFRATLSKAMLFILIVNSTDLSYKEKVKHIVYYLDKIKRELFEIKKALSVCSLKDEDIDKFIEFLQVYSVAEPLFKPSFLKTFFKIMVVLFIIFVVICVVIYFVVKQSGKRVEAYAEDWLEKLIDRLNKKTDQSRAIRLLVSLAQYALDSLRSKEQAQPQNADLASNPSWWSRFTGWFRSSSAKPQEQPKPAGGSVQGVDLAPNPISKNVDSGQVADPVSNPGIWSKISRWFSWDEWADDPLA